MSEPSSSASGPAAAKTSRQAIRTSSEFGSNPCSSAIPWIARISTVVVTGTSARAEGSPPKPPAAPIAVVSAVLNQSPPSGTRPREAAAAPKVASSPRFVAASSWPRTAPGMRSIRFSA